MRIAARLSICIMTLILLLTVALTNVTGQTCDPLVDYLTVGDQQYMAGDYMQAIASYTCALPQSPRSAAVYNRLGNAYRNMGEFQLAVDHYTSAIAHNPHFAHAYNNRGWAYYNLGQYEAALDDYNHAIELDPNLAYAYNNRGLLYQNQGKEDFAMADFNHALLLGTIPGNWAAHNLEQLPGADLNILGQGTPTAAMSGLQAQVAFQRGDYQLAIELFTQAITLDPGNGHAYIGRGDAYFALRDYDAAIADFTRAAELDPQSSNTYSSRGNVYLKQQNYNNAILDFSYAIQMNPQNSFAYDRIVEAYIQSQRTELGITFFTTLIENHPDLLLAYIGRARLYIRLHQPELALLDFDLMLQIAPDDYRLYIARAAVHLALARYPEAIADYTQAIELQPDNFYTYLLRAGVYKRLKYYDLVLADYTRVIELAPDHAGLHYQRGLVYIILGNADAAIADFTRAMELMPTAVQFVEARGDLYLQLGNHERALADYTRMIGIGVGVGKVYGYNKRANYYFDLGDYARALDDTNHAIELNANDFDALYLHAHIIAAQGDLEAAISEMTHLNEIEWIPRCNIATRTAPATPVISKPTGDIAQITAWVTEVLPEAKTYLSIGEAHSAGLWLDMQQNPIARISFVGTARQDICLQATSEAFVVLLDRDKTPLTWGKAEPGQLSLWLAYKLPADGEYETLVSHIDGVLPRQIYLGFGLDPLTLLGLGSSYYQMADYLRAAASYDAVLVNNPNDAIAYAGRGSAYVHLQQDELALADWARALELDPNRVDLLLERANYYYDTGQYDLALADLNRLDEIDPDNMQKRNIPAKRWKVHARSGDYESALADLNRAIEADFMEYHHYLMRASLYTQMGHSVEAAEDYRIFSEVLKAPVREIEHGELPFSVDIVIAEHEVFRLVLSGRAGQVLSVTTNSQPHREGWDVDPLLILLTADNQPLVSDDDGGGGLHAALEFALPANGAYTLLITHGSRGANGTITVTIELAQQT